MTYLTLDELLVRLQNLKDSGTPGDIPIARTSVDNNGRGGFVQRVESVLGVTVAKTDMDKGFSLLKTTSRGIDVLVLD